MRTQFFPSARCLIGKMHPGIWIWMSFILTQFSAELKHWLYSGHISHYMNWNGVWFWWVLFLKHFFKTLPPKISYFVCSERRAEAIIKFGTDTIFWIMDLCILFHQNRPKLGAKVVIEMCIKFDHVAGSKSLHTKLSSVASTHKLKSEKPSHYSHIRKTLFWLRCLTVLEQFLKSLSNRIIYYLRKLKNGGLNLTWVAWPDLTANWE